MVKGNGVELAPKDLRWRCDPDRLGFETTEDLECCKDIIGQDRAIDAIQLGLEMHSPGYNIFVSGLTGTGKSTTIRTLLRGMKHEKKQLLDLCYVYNFRTPEEPVCIKLPAGKGLALKRHMGGVLKTLREHIPKVFEGDKYVVQRKELVASFKNRRAERAGQLEKLIGEKGFQLLEVQYGPFTRPVIVPVIDGKPVEMDKLQERVHAGEFEEQAFETIRTDHDMLTDKMEGFLKLTRDMDREFSEKLKELEKRFAGPILDGCLGDVRDEFNDENVTAYLSELRDFVINNLELFAEEDDSDEGKKKSGTFLEFEVNVIVENSRTVDVPIIIETAPTYRNVFGTIERLIDGRGEQRTDLTMIRAGSLLRANGGFLVLSLLDMFEEGGVWHALKRALKNRKVSIQGIDSLLGSTTALKPEAIEVDVKVVLIGDAETYQILYHYDEDFRKIFKVKADFDTVMPNTSENLTKYGQFIANLTTEENLLPFHKSAVAACAEEGSEIAGRQDKLSTRFSDVADVAREASYWARKSNADVVMAEHVEKAVKERTRRVNLPEEKMTEMLMDGTILLDIVGSKIGQVNGLSVYDIGDYAFGKPVRITVETSMGRAGIINIEREAEMSGKSYNKGSLILEGYLRRRFAQDRPLTMSASICFEQSYGGVDGDSASSSEIYGMLSSLSDLPLRQDLAVTGSVNQKGEIQPIGGVNEKIKGFFDLCQLNGLTGRQGVIIPELNRVDLMLPRYIVEAVERGEFHIYAIDNIDEGVELLTGVPAGKELEDGSFEPDSVYARVDDKLARFAEHLKDYLETGDEKD